MSLHAHLQKMQSRRNNNLGSNTTRTMDGDPFTQKPSFNNARTSAQDIASMSPESKSMNYNISLVKQSSHNSGGKATEGAVLSDRIVVPQQIDMSGKESALTYRPTGKNQADRQRSLLYNKRKTSSHSKGSANSFNSRGYKSSAGSQLSGFTRINSQINDTNAAYLIKAKKR